MVKITNFYRWTAETKLNLLVDGSRCETIVNVPSRRRLIFVFFLFIWCRLINEMNSLAEKASLLFRRFNLTFSLIFSHRASFGLSDVIFPSHSRDWHRSKALYWTNNKTQRSSLAQDELWNLSSAFYLHGKIPYHLRAAKWNEWDAARVHRPTHGGVSAMTTRRHLSNLNWCIPFGLTTDFSWSSTEPMSIFHCWWSARKTFIMKSKSKMISISFHSLAKHSIISFN